MEYQQHQHLEMTDSLSINKVLRNTYAMLALTLTFSAVCSGIAMAMNISGLAGLVLALGGFATLFLLRKTEDSAAGIPTVFLFTGLMGASIGPMLNRYAALPNGSELIMQAMGATALIFFSLSAYALTTKKNFSFMGGFLFVGLILAVIASIANIFFQVPAMQLAINAIVVLLMSGFILYDTSNIVHGGETNYLRATVALYLNILNLFTSLLSLLGAFNSDD
jgi:modulator of FtsH protease